MHGKSPSVVRTAARADWKPNRANFWEARPLLFVCLLSPEILEPRRRQLGVADSVLDRSMA
jgi:hypothetical protein